MILSYGTSSYLFFSFVFKNRDILLYFTFIKSMSTGFRKLHRIRIYVDWGWTRLYILSFIKPWFIHVSCIYEVDSDVILRYIITYKSVSLCKPESDNYEISQSRQCLIWPVQIQKNQHTDSKIWILLISRELGELGYYPPPLNNLDISMSQRIKPLSN